MKKVYEVKLRSNDGIYGDSFSVVASDFQQALDSATTQRDRLWNRVYEAGLEIHSVTFLVNVFERDDG